MDKKKPPDRDLRRHFEAILGYEIEGLEVSVNALGDKIAVWSEESGQTHVTSREIGTTGDSTKACGDFRVLFVGGQTVTGGDGKAQFVLSDYHCLPIERPLVTIPDFPIIF